MRQKIIKRWAYFLAIVLFMANVKVVPVSAEEVSAVKPAITFPDIKITTPASDLELLDTSIFKLEGEATGAAFTKVKGIIGDVYGPVRYESIGVLNSDGTWKVEWNTKDIPTKKHDTISIRFYVNTGSMYTKYWAGSLLIKENQPPAVNLIKPSSHITLKKNDVFILEGSVSDAENEKVTVEAMLGGVSRPAITTTNVFKLTWREDEIPAGTFKPTIKATDASGKVTNYEVPWTVKKDGVRVTTPAPITYYNSSSSSSQEKPLYTVKKGKDAIQNIGFNVNTLKRKLRDLDRNDRRAQEIKVIIKKELDSETKYKLKVPKEFFSYKAEKEKWLCIMTPNGTYKVSNQSFSTDVKSMVEVVLWHEDMKVGVSINNGKNEAMTLQKPIKVSFRTNKRYAFKELLTTDQGDISIDFDSSKKIMYLDVNESGQFNIEYEYKEVKDRKEMIWAYKEMQVLASKDLVDLENGNYYPKRRIQRGEFVKYLMNVLPTQNNRETFEDFIDVSPSNFAYEAIQEAKEYNLVIGVGDNIFSSQQPLTRTGLKLIMDRVVKVYGLEENDDLTNLEEFMEAEGVTDHNLTRAEAAIVLYRLYQYIQ